MGRKVVSWILVLLMCVAPMSAFAARLWTSGFELNSCTANVEVITCDFTSNTPGTISSTQKHSGTYSFRSNPSGSSRSVGEMQFTSAGIGVTYARFYIYVVSYPGSNSTLSYISNASDNTLGGVFMNSSGQLGIEYRTSPSNQAYGSTLSSALSLNTWYRVEYLVDSSTVNQQVVTLRLDGTQIDSVTGTRTIAANSNQVLLWGTYLEGIESGSQDVYIDDIAVNNNSGGSQASYPGAGSIVYLRPNAQGDTDPDGCNNTSPCGTPANSFQNIDEVTPDDATSFIDMDTAINADWNMDDSSSAGIGANDNISLVDVGYRAREEASATTVMTPRIKSASGATASTLTAVDLGNTTWLTNQTSTNSFFNRLVSYTDPTTAVAWTPTGTNSIDNMQLGVGMTSGTVDFDVSALWAMVEYVANSAVTPKMRARLQNARFKLSGGRFILRSN